MGHVLSQIQPDSRFRFSHISIYLISYVSYQKKSVERIFKEYLTYK